LGHRSITSIASDTADGRTHTRDADLADAVRAGASGSATSVKRAISV